MSSMMVAFNGFGREIVFFLSSTSSVFDFFFFPLVWLRPMDDPASSICFLLWFLSSFDSELRFNLFTSFSRLTSMDSGLLPEDLFRFLDPWSRGSVTGSEDKDHPGISNKDISNRNWWPYINTDCAYIRKLIYAEALQVGWSWYSSHLQIDAAPSIEGAFQIQCRSFAFHRTSRAVTIGANCESITLAPKRNGNK